MQQLLPQLHIEVTGLATCVKQNSAMSAVVHIRRGTSLAGLKSKEEMSGFQDTIKIRVNAHWASASMGAMM